MKHFSRSEFLGLLTDKTLAESTNANASRSKGNAGKTPADLENSGRSGLRPYSGVWGKEQVLHLIRRTLFGVNHADYDYFSKLSLTQCLDTLLTQSPHPAPPVNAYNDSSNTDPNVPFGETWVLCRNINKGLIDDKRLLSLKGWWVGLMLNQDRSLTEKMTLFWHNHIAGEFGFMNDARICYTYAALLRHHALGNFKKLILEITTCPGMMLYLNGNANFSAAPNENYSRELQELFTVGKGPGSHYTQDDVVAAARVLTGWHTDDYDGLEDSGLKTIFMPERHDTGDKQFSAFYNNTVIKGKTGKSGAVELNELIDMIFAARETARHTCRCLYRWFVNSSIDSAVETNIIEPLADIFIENNYEMVPVLRALLGSEHFFNNKNIGCQIKNPVDHLIGFCRQFNVPSILPDLAAQYKVWIMLSNRLNFLSMCPGDPPNVAGWPAYYIYPSYDKLWINSDALVSRNLTTDLLAGNGIYDAESQINLQFDILAFTTRLSDPSDIDQLIIDSTALLSPVTFDSAQTAFLKSMLSSKANDGRFWRDEWTAFRADPDNPKTKSAVIGRLTPYYTYLLQQAECQIT